MNYSERLQQEKMLEQMQAVHAQALSDALLRDEQEESEVPFADVPACDEALLPRFRVGDRVRCVHSSSYTLRGREGVVRSLLGPCYGAKFAYTVMFDPHAGGTVGMRQIQLAHVNEDREKEAALAELLAQVSRLQDLCSTLTRLALEEQRAARFNACLRVALWILTGALLATGVTLALVGG